MKCSKCGTTKNPKSRWVNGCSTQVVCECGGSPGPGHIHRICTKCGFIARVESALDLAKETDADL